METVDDACFRPGIPPLTLKVRGPHRTLWSGPGSGQLRERMGKAACQQLPCSSGRALLGIGSGLTSVSALSICPPGGPGGRRTWESSEESNCLKGT